MGNGQCSAVALITVPLDCGKLPNRQKNRDDDDGDDDDDDDDEALLLVRPALATVVGKFAPRRVTAVLELS